jgi:hypothetical protein
VGVAAVSIALLLLPLSAWVMTGPYQTARQGLSGSYQAQNETFLPPPIPSETAFTDWVAGFVVMGQALAGFTQPGESLAAVPVGAIGYYGRLPIVDMVGLTEPEIAHQPFEPRYIATWRPGHDKGDGEYILSRQPTYIQLTDYLTPQPAPGPGELALDYKSIAEIWATPNFTQSYEFFPVQVQNGWYYNLYRRRDSAPPPQTLPPLADGLRAEVVYHYQQWDTLFVRLRWHAESPPTQAYTVFLHLIDDADTRLSGLDQQPPRPFTQLPPGESLTADYRLPLPADRPPGPLRLRLGLYHFAADGLLVDGGSVVLKMLESDSLLGLE